MKDHTIKWTKLNIITHILMTILPLFLIFALYWTTPDIPLNLCTILIGILYLVICLIVIWGSAYYMACDWEIWEKLE